MAAVIISVESKHTNASRSLAGPAPVKLVSALVDLGLLQGTADQTTCVSCCTKCSMNHSIYCCDTAAYYRQQQSISFAAAAALAAGAALYRHQSKGVTAGESLTSSAATSAPATTASTGTSASTDATAAGSSNSTDAAAATASSDTATTAGTAGAGTESSSVSNDEQKTDSTSTSLGTSTDDAEAALDQLLLQLLPFRVLYILNAGCKLRISRLNTVSARCALNAHITAQ
eukprot:21044-Heterococcus_DN1.PRE.1